MFYLEEITTLNFFIKQVALKLRGEYFELEIFFISLRVRKCGFTHASRNA